MSTAIHPVAPEEIMALLDGELSADRAQAVSTHTESCADCQEVLTSLRNSSQSLTNWRVGSAPPRLEDRIFAASAKNARNPRKLGSATFQRTRFWTWKHWMGVISVPAVSVMVLFVISFRALRPMNSVVGDRFETLAHEPSQGLSLPVDYARMNADAARKSRALSEGREYETDQKLVAPIGGRGASAPSGAPVGLPVQGRAFQQLVQLAPGPMIARTVSLNILANDFDASRNSLDGILVRHNGYSANLTVSTPQGAAKSLQASLRIPAPQLAAALKELKSLGRVENESQNGEEVTQQHADLVARLKNSRETEQRLQAILTQRTGKISDVLEVEQEIARVRGEIEQMEAEQKNLEHRVDFATIDLKISEEYKAQLNSPAASVSTQIHNALVNGYRNVADTLLGLILFFAEYGPVLLLWCCFLLIPAYLVWRRWRAAAAAA